MFSKRNLWHVVNSLKNVSQVPEFNNNINLIKYRTIYYTNVLKCEEKSNNPKSKELVIRTGFEAIKEKNRNTYLEMVKLFETKDIYRRGHVEFIYSALKNMKSFDVHKDAEVYKALVDVLPKGKFIPTNIFQAEFMHYPKQQQCIIDLLEQMEDNGVLPDYEMEDILMNIFGRKGFPLRKFWRMMYWMPKFKNLSPWPVPNPPPNDAFELAKLAIERISSADIQSKLTIYHSADIADSIEDAWIISSQSPTQKRLLGQHKPEEPIYVEGSFKVWLRNKMVNYFILRSTPKEIPTPDYGNSDDVSHFKVPLFGMFSPQNKAAVAKIPSVHEQDDGIIYSICATENSSKDSLLSWIRHLEKDNPILLNTPIVFTLRTAEKELAPVQDDVKQNKIEET